MFNWGLVLFVGILTVYFALYSSYIIAVLCGIVFLSELKNAYKQSGEKNEAH